MHEMTSTENYDDEFECSECDFKCTSEFDIMQHSTMHQCPNNTNDDLLNINPSGKLIKVEPNEYDTIVNLQTNFNSEEEIVSCTTLADTPEINGLGNYKYKVKRESNSLKVVSTTEIHNEIDIGNKMIKIENIDIKQENFPIVASHQINEKIINSNQNLVSLMPSENIHNNGRVTRNKAYDKNLYTEDDIADGKSSVCKDSIEEKTVKRKYTKKSERQKVYERISRTFRKTHSHYLSHVSGKTRYSQKPFFVRR
ncbi:unnamed protein product [Meganyctiphanes norvegica]|uniref:C2H2-type domain-containing protein n=1 Tax=Meganyctiphanes norvegica TaxID=48144 RepID=A0AAV2QHA5_MEGNR